MLKTENLSASYRENRVLDGVGFTLAPNTVTVVLGKNGCGKSTLISCISQQMRYGGEIFFRGENIASMSPRERAKKIAVLPQTMERPHLTVEELVMFGRNPYLDFGRRPSKEDRRAVREAIAAIGIGDFGKKMVDNLSGGERQKAYLAMILAQQTEMIILDEPTTYMDMENEAYFLEMIKKLKEEHKKTLLVIMHDLAQALRYGDHILVLDEQQIVFDGTSGECLESGILERVFHVKKHIFTENGEYYTMFTVQ